MVTSSLIQFNRERFLNWEKEYWWKPLDEAIYGIFRLPNDRNTIRSKCLLVSRCYLTSIERKAKITDIADDLLSSDEYQDVSQQLNEPPLNRGIFLENHEIYSIHKKLMKVIKRTTRTNEAVFASKFLHFSKPLLFPILDSVVEEKIERHEGIFHNLKNLKPQYDRFYPNLEEKEYDDRYCWYCFLLLNFSKYAEEERGIPREIITPKALDVYLYEL